MEGNKLFLANLSAALFLTGLSWFLYLVQMPVMAAVRAGEFPALMAIQRRRNTLLMAPVMAIEITAAVWLTFPEASHFNHRHMFHTFVLLVVVWLITFVRIVPLNSRLVTRYDAAAIDSLRRWNLLRTVVWTIRSAWILLAAVLC